MNFQVVKYSTVTPNVVHYDYLEHIQDILVLTKTEALLWYYFMFKVSFEKLPQDLQTKIVDWGKKYGTQNFDCFSDLVVEWIKENRGN